MPRTEHKDPRAVQLGEWLTEQRRRAGFKRPELVAEALKHDPRVSISPDYLAKLEYGTRSLASAGPDVREALRLALHIPADEWREATGLVVPKSEVFEHLTPRVSTVVRELPEDFVIFVETYAHAHPELRNPVVQQNILKSRLRDANLEPRRWYSIYTSLVDAFGDLSKL